MLNRIVSTEAVKEIHRDAPHTKTEDCHFLLQTICIFFKNKTKYYAWSGYKTANNKTPNFQNTEHKTAKQHNSEITKRRKTKWRSLQNSEHHKRANFCEKRRIDHIEYVQFSFRSIRCFSRSKNVNSPFCYFCFVTKLCLLGQFAVFLQVKK